MPLIALDILENKVKELVLTIQLLKDENFLLKKQLTAPVNKEISGTVNPQILYELESLRTEIAKIKNQKKFAYNKIYSIIGKLDSILNKTINFIEDEE